MDRSSDTLTQMPEVAEPDYKVAYAMLARRFSAIDAYINVGEIDPGKKISYLQDDVEQAMAVISQVENPFAVVPNYYPR